MRHDKGKQGAQQRHSGSFKSVTGTLLNRYETLLPVFSPSPGALPLRYICCLQCATVPSGADVSTGDLLGSAVAIHSDVATVLVSAQIWLVPPSLASSSCSCSRQEDGWSQQPKTLKLAVKCRRGRSRGHEHWIPGQQASDPTGGNLQAAMQVMRTCLALSCSSSMRYGLPCLLGWSACDGHKENCGQQPALQQHAGDAPAHPCGRRRLQCASTR